MSDLSHLCRVASRSPPPLLHCASPTPFVYDQLLLTMVGINAMAVVCNMATKPLPHDKHLQDEN